MYVSYRKEREGDIRRILSGWIFRTTRAIRDHAVRNVPRATGKLGQSIIAYEDYPVAAVAVEPKHARFVEGYPQATRRHFVPFGKYSSFDDWARRKGFDTSRGGLLVWGYATHFFSNAIKSVAPKAQAELSQLRLQ